MRIDFRQGIVTYPEVAGTGQAFLQVTGGGATVDLLTGSGQTTVAFAQRNADYLHIETSPVISAWSGISVGTTTWLFWDIDTQTGVRTFSQTIVQPVSQSTEPAAPTTDLHWFDTANMVMRVYDGTTFIERIRVFAARIESTTLFPVGTNAATPFAGTQAGVNQITFAGQILFAEGLPVIISVSGVFTAGQILANLGSPLQVTITTNPFARVYTFATTETAFLMGGSQKVNSIRLESDVTTATVTQNIAAYDVVKYSGFGTIEPAGYNDIDTTTLGIVVDGHAINEIATVILQGVVANESWTWTTIGAELFILQNGDLTETDPNLSTPSLFPVSKPPVARVLSRTEIIFMQGLGKVGPRGLNPASIGTIGDVVLTPPVTAGEVLQFTGSPERWRNDRPLIDDLEDVVITTPLFGQLLVFTGSPNAWRNSFEILNLEDLSDVTYVSAGSPVPAGSPSTAIAGDILFHNGTDWTNLARGANGQTLTMGSPLIPVWRELGTGSPIADENFLQYDGTNSTWANRTRRDANVGYFGVEPVTRNTSTVILRTDAVKGITSTTNGSPIGATSVTWTLRAGDFDIGDVITLVRRFNADGVTVAAGPNVKVISQIDGTSIGSPLPGAGSPNSNQFTLDNPAQATLWLHEVVGSPIRFGSPLPAGSPGLPTLIGSPGNDVWLLNGVGITFT